MIPTAEVQSAIEPCLWLRGILPAYRTEIEPDNLPPSEIVIRYDRRPESYQSGKYYGDASGGEFTSYPSLRRCGCSVVQVSETDGSKLHAARFSLPGDIQTVPRAELYCIVWLATEVEPYSVVHCVTDNLGLYDTYNKGEAAGRLSSNADLYNELFRKIKNKALQIKPTTNALISQPEDIVA